MDYNNIIIFVIFIALVVIIYLSYNKFDNKEIKKEVIENFYVDDLSIDTNQNNYSLPVTYVNDLIPTSKEINEFNYVNPSIKLEENNFEVGSEIIKKSSNSLENLEDFYNQTLNSSCSNQNYYDERFKKQLSKDLPLANFHSSLINKTDDFSISNFF
jgi:phage terminase large subunit-like protein